MAFCDCEPQEESSWSLQNGDWRCSLKNGDDGENGGRSYATVRELVIAKEMTIIPASLTLSDGSSSDVRLERGRPSSTAFKHSLRILGTTRTISASGCLICLRSSSTLGEQRMSIYEAYKLISRDQRGLQTGSRDGLHLRPVRAQCRQVQTSSASFQTVSVGEQDCLTASK